MSSWPRTWSWTCAILLAQGLAASAALLPPASSRALPRNLIVLDEQDLPHDLRETSSGTPSLLLPIFTRCGGTCPLTALSLKDGLGKAQAPFRVVLLSFDAEDAANDLKEFRERFRVPAEWILARPADGAALRSFLDQLDFHVMKVSEGFDHPNETFVFSPRGAWAATLAGTTFSKESLETAWRRALAADDPSAFRRLQAWLVRPEAWILLACGGTALSFVAILLLARKARTAGRVISASPPGHSCAEAGEGAGWRTPPH